MSVVFSKLIVGAVHGNYAHLSLEHRGLVLIFLSVIHHHILALETGIVAIS